MITWSIFMLCACSKSNVPSARSIDYKAMEFTSAAYNHFEGGILFADVQEGLDILWRASFKGKNAYKENLAFFVEGGLLITPNKDNTGKSASLGALQKKVENGKLYVNFGGMFTEVLGIIHTHPCYHSLPEPSPKSDYQYCYLGIHNYVMDHRNLFDAYKDSKGGEVYRRLGARNAYDQIPFNEVTKVSEMLVAVVEK